MQIVGLWKLERRRGTGQAEVDVRSSSGGPMHRQSVCSHSSILYHCTRKPEDFGQKQDAYEVQIENWRGDRSLKPFPTTWPHNTDRPNTGFPFMKIDALRVRIFGQDGEQPAVGMPSSASSLIKGPAYFGTKTEQAPNTWHLHVQKPVPRARALWGSA